MVFRFSEDIDKELIREAIKQKPYAAKYGGAAAVWVQVAKCVSAAVKVSLVDKQVQDRVRLLKKNWSAGELRAALGSGIEEARNATNEQSHYDSLPGLVGQYVSLEKDFKAQKQSNKEKKQAEEAQTNLCASQIVSDAITRRARRGENILSSDASSDSDDGTASVASTPSVSSISTPGKVPAGRRKSVFQLEVDRQEKRIRHDAEMRREQFDRQMQLQQQQHAERLAFEREQHENRLAFERERERSRERTEERLNRAREEAEERNRQLILQCVTIFSKSLNSSDKK
ncbi:hypothetical protein F442_22219 [Phytophthora nicotianae P10297]|uniref:Uncharacterized protein n=1 Tax=Phytophthora nicotianae P10297 TaxID=1317064 RepID=W2Y1I5_PHYNI|nr:hypothetical protein F442_22219 [Phytophthora nicotianae P10297]